MSKDWRDEYQTMIADCQNRESQLTEWEVNFLSSISDQLDDDRVLSAKQVDKLNAIWERVT